MFWLTLLFSCKPAAGPQATICDDLCDELVVACQYAAFPTEDSCVQGCLYNGSQGADIAGQTECVLAAECDTFEIVECEHAFGPEPAEASEE